MDFISLEPTLNATKFRSLRLRVLLNPVGSCGFPLVAITLPHLRDCHFLGVLCVWCLHDSEDGLNDKLSIESGDPVLVDSLRANLASVRLHAWMVDFCDELDLGRLERVVVREVEVYCESAANKWRALGPLNVNVPDHHVVFSWLNSYTCNRRTCQVTQFLVSKTTNNWLSYEHQFRIQRALATSRLFYKLFRLG